MIFLRNKSEESLLFCALYFVVFVPLNFVFLRFGQLKVPIVNQIVYESLIRFHEFPKRNAASSFREKHTKNTCKKEIQTS